MGQYYELWDSRTNNLIMWFETEELALQDVADEIAEEGEESVSAWGLLRGRDGKIEELVAEGAALAARARAAAAHAAD